MRRAAYGFFVILLVAVAAARSAFGEELQIGLSGETVSITSSFDGTEIVVFGTIENPDPTTLAEGGYDIVVVLRGPTQDLVVRLKENVLGIWVNGKSQTFANVPSSYSLVSTRKLEAFENSSSLKLNRVGFENLGFLVKGDESPAKDLEMFKSSLIRRKSAKKLYTEQSGGVEFLSPTLFRARIAVPANVPIGKHTARVYLLKNGEFLQSQQQSLQVRKTGFEQLTYDLAHSNGIIYGIVAVLIAMATGWLASVVFRKD